MIFAGLFAFNSQGAQEESSAAQWNAVVEGILNVDPDTAASSWRTLLEIDQIDLPHLVKQLGRHERVRPPARGWFPEAAFTHQLRFESTESERATVLHDGQPLGSIIEFFLKISTGERGEDFSESDWMKTIGDLPSQEKPPTQKIEPLGPIQVSVSQDYTSLTEDQKKAQRYATANISQLMDALVRAASLDLAREGLIGDPSPLAFDISADLTKAIGVVRIRRGLTDKTARDLLRRAASAGIHLREINFWNPEERIYEIDLRTGRHSLRSRSLGTKLELVRRLHEFSNYGSRESRPLSFLIETNDRDPVSI